MISFVVFSFLFFFVIRLICFQFVSNITLGAFMRDESAALLEAKLLCRLATDVLQALQFIHQCGICHNNINIDSILIQKDTGRVRNRIVYPCSKYAASVHLCRKRRIRYHETPCACFNTFTLNGEQYLGYFCWRKEHVNYRILFAEFSTKLSSIKLGNCENSRYSRLFTSRLAQRLSQASVSLQGQKYLVSTQFKLIIHQADNNY